MAQTRQAATRNLSGGIWHLLDLWVYSVVKIAEESDGIGRRAARRRRKTWKRWSSLETDLVPCYFFFRAAPIAILSSEASKVGLSLGSEHFVAL